MSLVIVPENLKYEIKPDMECHLGKLTLQTMKRFRQKLFQINFTDDSSETFKSVRLRSIRLAQKMQSRNIKLGDIIMVCAPNHNDACIPIVASLYLGTAVFPLAENQTLAEWCHNITLAKPAMIFCGSSQTTVVEEAVKKMGLKKVEIVVFGNDDHKFTAFSKFVEATHTEESFEVTEFNPDTTTAIISCTSGSTGYSKAVCLTHRQLTLALKLPTASLNVDELARELVLNFSNLFWISGSILVLCCCLYGQTKLQSSLPFNTDSAVEAIQNYKPTMGIFGVSITSEILNYPYIDSIHLNCFRNIISIGTSLPTKLVEKFHSLSPKTIIQDCYGMTECCGALTAVPQNVKATNTCGKVLPWIEWMIVDRNTEEKLGPNQTGELRCRGPTFFKEYHNDPESTTRAFTHDRWFKTGDLMYYNEEGYLFFVDRVKYVFKYCSYQICPSEVEYVINKLDGVMKCCVMGKSDGFNGELPMAFVEKTPGLNVTADEIKNIVKDTLADWKQLRGGVAFMDSLPITYSGKVDRKLLKTLKETVKTE